MQAQWAMMQGPGGFDPTWGAQMGAGALPFPLPPLAGGMPPCAICIRPFPLAEPAPRDSKRKHHRKKGKKDKAKKHKRRASSSDPSSERSRSSSHEDSQSRSPEREEEESPRVGRGHPGLQGSAIDPFAPAGDRGIGEAEAAAIAAVAGNLLPPKSFFDAGSTPGPPRADDDGSLPWA